MKQSSQNLDAPNKAVQLMKKQNPAALAPSAAFDKWDGPPPTSGYGRDLIGEEHDRADRKRAFLAGVRWQKKNGGNKS